MKITRFLIVTVFMILCFAGKSFALGNATAYWVTVKSIQLKNDAGQWVTIATPNQDLDIAGVSPGAVVHSFMNDAVIPPGNYVNFKVVLSETVRFAGTDGATNITGGGGSITISGTAASAASTATWPAFPPTAVCSLTENGETWKNSGSPELVTAYLDLANDGNDYMEVLAMSDLTTPVAIKSDSTISMYFDFDTQNTILLGGVQVMTFLPPQQGTQFGITVDGRSITVSAANMKIDF
jgi:hypothetical protein